MQVENLIKEIYSDSWNDLCFHHITANLLTGRVSSSIRVVTRSGCRMMDHAAEAVLVKWVQCQPACAFERECPTQRRLLWIDHLIRRLPTFQKLRNEQKRIKTGHGTAYPTTGSGFVTIFQALSLVSSWKTICVQGL